MCVVGSIGGGGVVYFFLRVWKRTQEFQSKEGRAKLLGGEAGDSQGCSGQRKPPVPRGPRTLSWVHCEWESACFIIFHDRRPM